jgi:hypothetical protein
MAQKPGAGGRSRPARRSQPTRKPFFLQRVRRRDLILLTGVLSFACFSMITVALLILRFQSAQAEPVTVIGPTSTPGPQPTHTVTHVALTGLSQYPLAEAEARRWAGDARLVAASTNWPGVLGVDQIGLPGSWSYRFYSPGKERLYIVRVEPDGQVEAVEHRVKITVPPDLLETGTWAIDSPTALATWLDYGGAELVRRNPGLEVLIQLRSLANHPQPVWMVVGTDKRTQDIHVVVIDAVEGAVLSTRPAN